MSEQILMPALSPTMEEGTLSKWLIKIGDKVSTGDLIAEIETDKATMEVESIYDGIVGDLYVSEGETSIKVNTPIAILIQPGEKIDLQKPSNNNNLDKEKPLNKNQQNNTESNDKSETNINSTTVSSNSNIKEKRIFVSPLAKRIAKEKGIDLKNILGTGPYGRIVKKDLIEFQPRHENVLDVNKINNSFELIKNNSMRKTIANRLVKSVNEAPHYYLSIDCTIDKLKRFRVDINKELSDNEKISLNDIIVKVAGLSLLKVPECNVSWENDHTKFFKSADISIAVAIEGGLITPIVRSVEKKGLLEISNEIKSLIEMAKNNKLSSEQYLGGTFSISNLGMFGIKNFTSIINPPQSAILAIGSGNDVPVVVDNKIDIRCVMNVTMSCDHRVIDGSIGAKFLSTFKKYIENPSLLTL